MNRRTGADSLTGARENNWQESCEEMNMAGVCNPRAAELYYEARGHVFVLRELSAVKIT
jgi:hypothetical protein